MLADTDTHTAARAFGKTHTVDILVPIRLGSQKGQMVRVDTCSVVAFVRDLMRSSVPHLQLARACQTLARSTGWRARYSLCVSEVILRVFLQFTTPTRVLWRLGQYEVMMVARLKLKGIDGRAHQEWSLRLNLTQHGETYQVQT